MSYNTVNKTENVRTHDPKLCVNKQPSEPNGNELTDGGEGKKARTINNKISENSIK